MGDVDRRSLLAVIITSAVTATIPFLRARGESEHSA